MAHPVKKKAWTVYITGPDGNERILKTGIPTVHQARQYGAAYRRRHVQFTWRVG